MNVKKLVYLCISIALLIVSLVFSVDGPSVNAEFAPNKGEAITETTQLSDIIANLPSSQDYYYLENATNENFKSVTMVEEGKAEYNTGFTLNRTLTIYFTEKGAYYQTRGVQSQRTETENGTFNVDLIFDAEIYITNEKVFIKYNRYESKAPAGVEIDEMQVKMFDTIKKNYGKWIDLSYSGPKIDPENPEGLENMTEEEIYKNMLIQETSLQLINAFISINDSNVAQLQGLGAFIATNIDKFLKSENSYTLDSQYNDLLSAYLGGFKGQFNVNLNNPNTPRMHFNGNLSTTNTTLASIEFTTTFKNVGNTSVNVPEEIDYDINDFLGEYFDELFNQMKGEN